MIATLEKLSKLGGLLSDDVVGEESRALVEQLAREELNVLVVGQFKRGKSTVVNALIEEDLMPTGALPLTGVATAIRYGSPPAISVRLRDGRTQPARAEELALFVSERMNPKNARGVVSVDVVRQANALRGIALFDTPGVGSTFHHNTEAARAILPRTDAAVLVVGPDPPIGAKELEYACAVAQNSVRLFVLFNKADLAGSALDELLDFTRAALADAGISTDVFPISAMLAREAQRGGGSDGDFARFLSSLRSFVDERGSGARVASAQRRATALFNRASALLQLRAKAIALPESERKQRRALLETALAGLDDRVRFLELAVDDDVKRLRLRLEDTLDRRYDEEHEQLPSLVDEIASSPSSSVRRESLESSIAQCAQRWRRAAVEQAQSQMQESARAYERSLAEIEQAVVRAGCKALHVDADTFSVREIAFAPAALTLPVSTYPTTGLELLRDFAISLLPRSARERASRKRIARTLESEMDALRGKLRYGIAHDLEPWRRSVRDAIRATLSATRSAVLAAFPSESQGGSEEGARNAFAALEARLSEIRDGIDVAR